MDGCRKRGTDGGWSNYRRIRNNWRISERVVTGKGVWGNQGWGDAKRKKNKREQRDEDAVRGTEAWKLEKIAGMEERRR